MKFDQPLYLVIMQAEDKYYLLAEKRGIISAFKTEQEALDYFEKPYRESHSRSYERSMSACINWLSFSPSVVPLNSDEEFEDYFENGQAQYVSVRNISGGFCGAITKKDLKILFDGGKKPALYKEEWYK